MTGRIAWVAVDWGTSRLRAWALDAGGRILARRQADEGMGGLTPEAFEPVLLSLLEPWRVTGERLNVVACGMVGARQGWIEAAYAPVPCAPLAGDRFIRAPTRDPDLAVLIVPGLSQAQPADVMRGEETQIAGLLAERPDFEGALCLPGTHSKWVAVAGGRVRRFMTCMTGELFALLAQHSILRHSLNGTADGAEPFEAAAFEAAVTDTLGRPGGAAERLFAIRAGDLLHGETAAAARARLSGALIAQELDAARSYWQGKTVVMLGAEPLVAHYARALALAGGTGERVDGEELTVAGLRAAAALAGGEEG